MRKTLMTTASALSLILATAAWAQTRDEGGAGGAGGQGQGQMAPGGGEEPSMHGGASGGAQPGKGEMRGEQGGKTLHQGRDENLGGEKSKGAENGQGLENKGEHEQMQRQGAGEKMQGETSKGAERERGESGKAASLSSEQKTRVRSSFHGASIREAHDINVTHVSIGGQDSAHRRQLLGAGARVHPGGRSGLAGLQGGAYPRGYRGDRSRNV